MFNFQWYRFSELTTKQLYAVLALRAKVFVVEQNCVYLDPDDKDMSAIHLLGFEEDSLIAYLRLFPPTDKKNYVVFGRVVTKQEARKKGHGKKIIQELLNYCATNFPKASIKCSAQHYLKKLYESFGFQAQGEIYDEDGIPHIAMLLEKA